MKINNSTRELFLKSTPKPKTADWEKKKTNRLLLLHPQLNNRNNKQITNKQVQYNDAPKNT
jgi:hypothetical protein